VPSLNRKPTRSYDIPVGEAPIDEEVILQRVALRIFGDLTSLMTPSVQVDVSSDDDDRDSYHLEFKHPDGFHVPIFVEIFNDDEEAAIVDVLELLLDSALFDGTEIPWPVCPRHIGSGHSLVPKQVSRIASWACPVDGEVIAEVGSLNDHSA
jgi:hypothetical protein